MYHSRRKSGHGSTNTSMTDVRKAGSSSSDRTKSKSGSSRSSRGLVSPSPSATKLGKNRKDRERELEDEMFWDEERDSFPQFCMTCEKQFFSHDDRMPYCSDACRQGDYEGTGKYGLVNPHPISTHSYLSVDHPEPRDIVPRASPSRPTSTHFASPPSPPDLPHTYHHSSAVSALRNINMTACPPSPQSPGVAGGIWPFSTNTTTSPSSSYTRSNSGFFSSTYDTSYAYQGYQMPADRPLPSRRPGAGYSRPKSIELVTPMIGR